jgi:hypothetical protein
MRKFFEDKDNRAKFIEDLKLVGEAIKGIVWVVGKLIEGFKWLKDIVGPEWAVAIAAVLFMFGPAIAGALISGLLGALSAAALAPIGLAVAGAIASAVGGYLIGDALRKAIESTEIGKLIMDMIARAITAPFLPTKTGVQISPEMAKRIEDARRKGLIKDRGPGTGNVENPYSDYDTPQYQHGGIVNANLHDGEMVLPRNISEGLQRMFGPHPDNLLESGDPGLSFKDFFEEVQRWWSGDASFRPIVDLADRFYERMSELLINVLDQTLKAMGYKDGIYGAAGTTGASPGAAPAPGGPTPGTPGTPGSPTGTPGGGVEFPPDWKPPEGTQTTSSGMEISHPERNNPGNLRVGGGDWLGKNTRPGQAFESFDTMAHGIRARIITYNSYFKRGLDTIAKIAEASGPGFENNMKAQLEAYKTAMGGDYNKPGGENLPIQLTPENLRKLTIAGISFEHGGKGVKLPKGAGEKEINEEMLKLMEEQKASGGTGVPGGPGDPNAVYGERITPQLKALLAKVAADQGVKFGVHSGIRQPGGSGRHDPRGGMGAADTYIYDQKTGRMLNPTDPNDFARLGQIAEEAYRLGAKGIGAGEGYMGGRSLHIGGTGYSPTGTAYWGTGEHEAGAMPWLKEAYRRSQQRQVAAATKKVAETAKKATDAATGRDRTGPLVEGGKTYPEGVMSPSELEQWHNAQQKVSEVTGTKLGGGAGGGTSGNRQVAMNTTNNYYINGAGDPHHTQKLIDESHKRRGHEEQRNSRAFLA